MLKAYMAFSTYVYVDNIAYTVTETHSVPKAISVHIWNMEFSFLLIH